MRRHRKLNVILLTLVTLFTVNIFLSNAAKADSLQISGGVVTWPDKMYLPDGCSSFPFQYRNDTGVKLLQLGILITDPYGRNIAQQSEIGIPPSNSGTWNLNMCGYYFKNGLGPYTIKIYIEDFESTQREIQKDIYFLPIPNSTGTGSPNSGLSPTPTVTQTKTPTPAATVYVSNPADKTLTDLITSLKNQLNNLTAKINKICAVKPKPKGCATQITKPTPKTSSKASSSSIFATSVILETGFALTKDVYGQPVGLDVTKLFCTTGTVWLPTTQNSATIKRKLGASVRLEAGGKTVALGTLDSFELVGDENLPNDKYPGNLMAGSLCVLKGTLKDVPKYDFYTVYINNVRADDFTFEQVKNGIKLSVWRP